MSPFLFPFILILYSEKGKLKTTRFMARVFFYSYTLSVLTLTYLPATSFSIFISGFFLIGGLLFLLYKNKIKRVTFPLIVLLVLTIINYGCLLSNNYVLYYMIPYYFEYSNLILRELTILTITLCNVNKEDDKNLWIITVLAYIVEYSYITGL